MSEEEKEKSRELLEVILKLSDGFENLRANEMMSRAAKIDEVTAELCKSFGVDIYISFCSECDCFEEEG